MTFAVGEVREFATGMMICVANDGITPGSFQAKMQTIQKIWTGERWAEAVEPAAAHVLSAICEDRRK